GTGRIWAASGQRAPSKRQSNAHKHKHRRRAGHGRSACPARIRDRLIAAIVLAAGLARRMGRQKLLLDLKGKPVVRWSVEAVLPHVDDCVVVTGHDDARVRAALTGLGVPYAVTAPPTPRQASSLALDVAALEATTPAMVVVLGDQPLTPRDVVPALLTAQQQSGKAIVAPSYRGTRGTAVLFGAAVFPELRTLAGDSGAREVVRMNPER